MSEPRKCEPTDAELSELGKEYLKETGLRPVASEPGRLGIWHTSAYVEWLEQIIDNFRNDDHLGEDQ